MAPFTTDFLDSEFVRWGLLRAFRRLKDQDPGQWISAQQAVVEVDSFWRAEAPDGRPSAREVEAILDELVRDGHLEKVDLGRLSHGYREKVVP